MRSPLALFALLLALAVAACAQTPPKPKAESFAAPRTGTVGHIAEVKTRGMAQHNWLGLLTDLYKGESGNEVKETSWEVTVFYDDHTHGVVPVPDKPDLRVGQKVRVTGTKIEPASR